MSEELLYTSAPQGLQNSKYGFCTVLASEGLDLNLAKQLEALSGYRHLFPLGSESEHKNPVAYSHVKLSNRYGSCSVVSRITSYNADYTGRSNKIAHHIVLTEKEHADAGPAWLVQQNEIFRTIWDGNPRTVTRGPLIPIGREEPKECSNWERLTGDAGLGGYLADFIQHSEKIIWLIYPLELRDEALALIKESIQLLPSEKRWDVTFSTYASEVAPNVTCKVRGVVEGTKEARLAKSRGIAFSLSNPPKVNDNSAFVQRARRHVFQHLGETEVGIHTKGLDPPHEHLLRQPVSISSQIEPINIESYLHTNQLAADTKPPALPHEKKRNHIYKALAAIIACLLLLQQSWTHMKHGEKPSDQKTASQQNHYGEQKQISAKTDSIKLPPNDIEESTEDNLKTQTSPPKKQPDDQRPPASFTNVPINTLEKNTDSNASNSGDRQIRDDIRSKHTIPANNLQVTNRKTDPLQTSSISKKQVVPPAIDNAILPADHSSVYLGNNIQPIDATAHIAIEDLKPNIFRPSDHQTLRISIQAKSHLGPVGKIIKANHNSFNEHTTALTFTIPKQRDFTHRRFPISTSSRQTKPITIALMKQDSNTTGKYSIQIRPESDEIFIFLTISTKYIDSDFFPLSLRQHYRQLQSISSEVALSYQKLPELNTTEDVPSEIIQNLNQLKNLLRKLLSSVHTPAERRNLIEKINVSKLGILEQISVYSVIARSNEPTGIGDENIRYFYNHLAKSIRNQCNQILAKEQSLNTQNHSLLNPTVEEHLVLSCLDFELLDSPSKTEAVTFRFDRGKINYFSIKQAASEKYR